ncbi:hypothetical protein NDU88_006567 [Pleurodeles waltl]|uniref:Uncharacterized protein n=1 Tax=Pleurodeles waltl TaxID=8319 RepID=A0AAV7NSB6_PLEWA|nr:hypothetical protein NDU88_006567 [Pleurodeles waltl]
MPGLRLGYINGLVFPSLPSPGLPWGQFCPHQKEILTRRREMALPFEGRALARARRKSALFGREDLRAQRSVRVRRAAVIH